MDTRLESDRAIIERVLTEYSKYPYSYGQIERQLVFDRERDHYLLLSVGWDKSRVHGCVIHIDLIDGKCWIQRDGTETGSRPTWKPPASPRIGSSWRSSRRRFDPSYGVCRRHRVGAIIGDGFLEATGDLSHAQPISRNGPLPGTILGGSSSHNDHLLSSDALQKHLPGDLPHRVDERVFVEPVMGQPRNIIPDVRVVERGRREESGLRASNGIAVAEPLVVHLDQDEPVHQGFIEIIDIKSGRRVVTVIEILSPSNKLAGPGRDLYLKKQEELRAGGVSLVEINLNRTGSHVLTAPFDRIPEGYRTPYAGLRAAGMEAPGDRLLSDRLARAAARHRHPPPAR